MRVYSPTETQIYAECPVKRVLSYQMRWRPKRMGKNYLMMEIGKAGAAALEQVNRGFTENAQEVGLAAIKRFKDEAAQLGISTWDQKLWDSMEHRVQSVITRYLHEEPLDKRWEMLECEEYSEKWHVKPDLVVKFNGVIWPIDYKITYALPADYVQKRKMSYKGSWQMKQYCLALSEKYGVPVMKYMICLIVLEPRVKFDLWTYELSKDEMEQFKLSAEGWWAEMERLDEEGAWAREAPSHELQFGMCEYYKACFSYGRNATLMAHEFVQVSDDRTHKKKEGV